MDKCKRFGDVTQLPDRPVFKQEDLFDKEKAATVWGQLCCAIVRDGYAIIRSPPE